MFEPPRRGQGPEFNFEEILGSIGSFIGRITRRLGGGGGERGARILILIVVGVAVVLWLASGIYTVGPRERAALQLFGAFQTIEGPGLNWYFPSPIGKRTIVDVEVTRNMELGVITAPNNVTRDVLEEALMITGDLNIVNVQMVVQYRIADLEQYLFRVDDPGEAPRGVPAGHPDGRTLKDATEASLRQIVGQRSIDDVLVLRRGEVEADVQLLLQQTLDFYQAGILVLNVALQTVRPPDQVRAAFDDVVNARVDKESRINEAKAFEQDRLPRIVGEAQQIVQSAEAFKAERIARATGEADRFLSVLEEYQKSREVTRQRLYLEAMEEILPGIKKFILAGDGGGNLLQFLPLTGGEEATP
ncbi:MAG: FtsH protease activity modulator HflK [Chloroflexi bacterium]|nr:FtsH protease activity modulator HflK [Chloroflexota bacterium]